MPLPIVAVIGRPNVGKSTLVNRIAQTRDAIVHESRGVTRDRSYHHADWNGREFILIDTGGIEMGQGDSFQTPIRQQALIAAEEADVIIFLVDGMAGITSDDEEIARILRKTDTPVFLTVNKMDTPGREDACFEFYNLGIGDPWPVSAVHGNGTGDLLDAIVGALPEAVDEPTDDGVVNVAIVGRPNAGKSSLANRLIGSERSIVSDIAGTTRDAIDTVVSHGDRTYRIVDTAGLRRKSLIEEDVEYYGFVRALRAIERADVAVLIIDSTVGLTDQDQHVAALTLEQGCGLVILLNKWDLMKDATARDDLTELVEDRLMFVSYAPVVRISALTGRSVDKTWELVDTAYDNASKIIPTNRLNNLLVELKDFGHTVSHGTKRLKLNFLKQSSVRPPVFTFFVNVPEIIDDTYERYLENRIREKYDFTGTPIRIRFKRKS